MAIKATAQETIIDITDAYSVYLTCASYTFPGTTTTAKAGSCATSVIAMRGAEQVKTSVDATKITKPAGVNVTAVANESGATDLTISVTTAVTGPGKVSIPVLVDGQAQFTVEFSFGVAFTGSTGATGVGVKSIVEQYAQSDSATTAPVSGWTGVYPAWVDGKYLWTRSVITYTDNSSKQTQPICVTGGKGQTGAQGGTGATGVGIKTVDVQYYLSTSATELAGGTWTTTAPAWQNGKYMWSKTVTVYTDGKKVESDPACITGSQGATGPQGPQGPAGPTGNPGANGHMLYGVCTTAAGTAAKTVNINGFALYAGVTIAVTFQYGNTAASPTIDVNGTGAKLIYTNGVKYMYAGTWQCVTLVYDPAGYWYVCSQPVYANTATIGNPAGGNAYIDGDSFDIRKGSTTLATFSNANVELGKDSRTARVSFCGGQSAITGKTGSTRDNIWIESGDVILNASGYITLQGAGVEIPTYLTLQGSTIRDFVTDSGKSGVWEYCLWKSGRVELWAQWLNFNNANGFFWIGSYALPWSLSGYTAQLSVHATDHIIEETELTHFVNINSGYVDVILARRTGVIGGPNYKASVYITGKR